MDAGTRALVISRADNRCEYCRLHQGQFPATFHVDHIRSRQHISNDKLDNLAWCCPRCNRRKGTNLSGIDPLTQAVVPLFHPRLDRWSEHFQWDGLVISGLTAAGRATIIVLDLNGSERIRLRQALMAEGEFPPA